MVTTTINPSYCSYKPTERYLGGPTLYQEEMISGGIGRLLWGSDRMPEHSTQAVQDQWAGWRLEAYLSA